MANRSEDIIMYRKHQYHHTSTSKISDYAKIMYTNTRIHTHNAVISNLTGFALILLNTDAM